MAAAATNMTIFQINRRRAHKFVFSALLFGFCMARITTLALRIAWASYPSSVNVAIAAGIFVQAGVVLLLLVNLVFAQRLLRSYHPRLGWSRAAGLAFRLLYLCVPALLVMAVAATADSFFTLAPPARRAGRDVQLLAGTSLAALALLPFPVAALAARLARRPEAFGRGRRRARLGLLLSTSALLSLGAGFRAGVGFAAPRPAADPAWYHGRPCFYCFNFATELLVVYAYTVSRFDRRFHVPDGSSGPGHYSGVRVVSRGKGKKDRGTALGDWEVNQERDVFGDEGKGDDSPEMNKTREHDWEARATEELDRGTIG